MNDKLTRHLGYKKITDILNTTSNGLDLAFFHIKEDETIGACNDVAKEVFGITVPLTKNHDSGKIEKGDIVILADSYIGLDDNLTVEDLKLLNIHNPDIEMGNAILAVGIYDNDEFKPSYKYFKKNIYEGNALLEEEYMGIQIRAEIDFGKRHVTISVANDEYRMNYVEGIANMVIIDGETGGIKFFQTRGFTLRDEEVGTLLRGKKYAGKNDDGQADIMIPVIGEHMEEIFFGDEFIACVRRLLQEEHEVTERQVFRINNFILYCQLVRINMDGYLDGLFIFIRDDNLIQNQMTLAKELLETVELARKKKEDFELRGDVGRIGEFIGASPEMMEVKQLAYRAAKGSYNVIITGESGTGKSKLAREIHNLRDKEAPFVEVTCNAIAPNLIESSLFGYVGGAFTGASSQGKAGFFEEAKGGTIFLDEIGEVSLDIQVKLLQVMQTKKIYRVGSAKPIDIDVRIICATNRNLEEEVLKGNFRQDLFYRINVFPIRIPSLRERKSDMYVLANNILDKVCRTYGLEEKHFSGEALNLMNSYSWPGNVRELENIIERAVIICDGPVIYAEHMIINTDTKVRMSLKERLEIEERRIIAETLHRNMGNRNKTMEELKMGRSSFYDKLRKFGL